MKRIVRAFAFFPFLVTVVLIACNSDAPSDTVEVQIPSIERNGLLVRINAKEKSFLMGSKAGNTDEIPEHTVTFSHDFWMDSIEVTQGIYDRTMKEYYPAYYTPFWSQTYGLSSQHPAYQIEWGDAVLFCNARSLIEGFEVVYSYTTIRGIPGNGCTLEGVTADFTRNGYRLPTEAEWEFACRGGSTTDYSWGKTYSPYPASPADTIQCNIYAVWAGNSWNHSSDSPLFGTHPAASKQPNAYGLYDMHGNVWEWCHDWYDTDYYSVSPVRDPVGPSNGDWHSLRGGSWGNDAYHLRVSNRNFVTPDYLFNFIGFRCVRYAQ